MIIQNYKACLSIAKQHYFIHLLVAIETLVFYSDSSIADASDLFKIIFCSWFAFSFSLCLGWGFLLCVHGATRNVYSSLSKVYFVFVILVNTYVIVDQVYYKVNFAHMTLSAVGNDQSLSLQKFFILFGSFVAETDGIFYMNIAVLLTLSCFSSRILMMPRIVSKGHKKNELDADHNILYMKWQNRSFLLAYIILTSFFVQCKRYVLI